MRCLPGAPPIWNPPWIDRFESTVDLVVGRQAAESAQCRIVRLALHVLRMIVFAGRIGLPDLQHSIRNRCAVTVHQAKTDTDVLAFRIRPPKATEGRIPS